MFVEHELFPLILVFLINLLFFIFFFDFIQLNNLRQQCQENHEKLSEAENNYKTTMNKENELITELSETLESIKNFSEQVSSVNLEESIQKIESQNEMLCNSVQEFGTKLSESNISNEILKKRNSELTKKLDEQKQEVEKLNLENLRYKSQLTLQKNLCKCVLTPSYSQTYSHSDTSQRFSNEFQRLHKRASEEIFKREENHRAFSQKIEMLDNKIYLLESSLDQKDKELNRAKNRLQEASDREDQLQSKFDLINMQINEIENEKYL